MAVTGLIAGISTTTYAGGNSGQMIARFEPVKSVEQIAQLNEGDSVVKVCRACRMVELVRIEKGGKGLYDVVAKKCGSCGSDDTYVAVAKTTVPFKEQVKR